MFTVTLSPGAAREFRKLTRDVQLKLKKAIDGLATEPRPEGVRKLADTDDLYRVRVGNYRIIYKIDGAELVVLVVGIGDRKEIYRRFG